MEKMNRTPQKKNIVFDMDGVILDSEQILIDCWNDRAAQLGLTGMDDVIHRCLGINVNAARELMKDAFGRDFEYDVIEAQVRAMFAERTKDGVPLKKGAAEVLSALKKNGWGVALASSTRSPIVMKELEYDGIISFFDIIICGDMVNRSKPFPDIFLEACRGLGAVPAETFAAEDSYNGVRAAKAAGMRVIMIPDLMPVTEEMRGLAEHICCDLFQAWKYMEHN